MNKKIIGILSAVTLIGGAVYLSGQGGFGALSSSAIGSAECSAASQSAGEAQYIKSAEHIANLEEQITKIQKNTKEREKDNEKISSDIKELQKELLSEQSVHRYISDSIKKDKCAEVTKTIGASRGGSQPNPLYETCEEKKKEAQKVKNKIEPIQTTLKNKNESLKKNREANKEATKNLREFQKRLKEHTEYRKNYETCKGSLAVVPETGGDLPPATPETGGDLPPVMPETGGDLPPATDTQSNTTPPATTSTPMTDTILVDATIDTFDKLRIESYKLSTSYNVNTVFTEDKLKEIAARFDILSATLVALKEGTSEGGNVTPTDWDSVLKSLYAQRNKIEAVEETIWRRHGLVSLINNYKADKKKSKNSTSTEVSTRIEGIGVVKINSNSSDKDIARVNNLIKEQDQILAQKNQQLNTLNNQIKQAIAGQSSQKTSAEQREKFLKESATQIEQVEMYLSKVRSLVESFRTGKDNETTCTIQADWKPLDNTLVESTTATLRKFSSGTGLGHFTKGVPSSNPNFARAEEAYTEIKNVLPQLENEVSRYESQDNTTADPAPVECLQWWNAEKQKRRDVASSNGKLSIFKPQVVEFRRFITWMDQNHFTGNN